MARKVGYEWRNDVERVLERGEVVMSGHHQSLTMQLRFYDENGLMATRRLPLHVAEQLHKLLGEEIEETKQGRQP